MKKDEIRKLSVEKLVAEIDDAREKLMRMRFQIATGELKDQNQPRLARREVARMLTILREKRAEQKTEGEA
ncbi:MAG: 50S ribosomal protein L29 [Anaerolineales bacterium]